MPYIRDELPAAGTMAVTFLPMLTLHVKRIRLNALGSLRQLFVNTLLDIRVF
jgi:hypothetical protein